MRNITLGKRLFLLALAGIVPLAAMSGIALLALVQQQRAQAERSSLEIVRALAIGVDGEVQRSITALGTLATSNALEAGDIEAFRRRAERVMKEQPHWMVIILADTQGKVLLNTNIPSGSRQPPVAEMESFNEAVRTRKPVVGYLARGQRGNFGLPLRVPVEQNGQLRYVLTGVIKPQVVVDVIDRQRVPNDWVVSVFDAKGLRVARSRAHEKFIGKPPSPSLQTLMANGKDEGTGITTALEGDSVHTAYVRLKNIGWTVAIGVPLSTVNLAGYRSLAVYGGGLLLSLLLGVLASLAVAHSINRPIRELRAAAQALGHGQFAKTPVASAAIDIPETREVTDALATAAKQLAANAAEREKLLDDTEAARLLAETANRTKDEFLAMLSHELRNPLAAIVNALELMNVRNHAVNARERQIIGRQIAHLSHLVDDLLDVARITKGKVQLQRSPVDMRTVVTRAIELTEPIFSKRTRPLDIAIPREPVFVSGDAVRLAQIVSNLLTNAAKFTPPDGRIALRLKVSDGMTEVAVEDEGSGIAAELLPHVFDVFMQGQQPIDRQAGGLGLGLAIVKALVHMHDGTVLAESKGTGLGSVFTVRLPLLASGKSPASPDSGPAFPVASGKHRILVVDDNVDASETMAQLLRETAGHEVRTETDGPAALAALAEFHPDIAILDIGLPGMTGYELARRLREDPHNRDLHIIAVSGYGAFQDRLLAQESGFDEHLTKPVALARLIEAIESVAGKAPIA